MLAYTFMGFHLLYYLLSRFVDLFACDISHFSFQVLALMRLKEFNMQVDMVAY